MAGRKPVPTALRVLRGNPGKHPLNTKEPRPERGLPTCPGHLDRVAKHLWKELGTVLDRMKVMTHADRRALELLVDAYATYRLAKDGLKEHGLTYTTTTPAGDEMVRQRPEVMMAAEAAKRVRQLLVDFGLTPSSRSKIQVAGQPPCDPFEEFLGGKKTGPPPRDP